MELHVGLCVCDQNKQKAVVDIGFQRSECASVAYTVCTVWFKREEVFFLRAGKGQLKNVVVISYGVVVSLTSADSPVHLSHTA